MNVENLKKLKDWFDSGAPHFFFNMSMGYVVGTAEDIAKRAGYEGVSIDQDQPIPNSCGSAGCIAGAACVVLETRPVLNESETFAMWYEVRNRALRALGLPRTDTDQLFSDAEHYGHPLFDPELAPKDCTPAQASKAIQNVIDGKAPWVGVA